MADKNIQLLNKKIADYLTDIATLQKKAEDQTQEISRLNADLNRQKGELTRAKETNDKLIEENKKLKNEVAKLKPKSKE